MAVAPTISPIQQPSQQPSRQAGATLPREGSVLPGRSVAATGSTKRHRLAPRDARRIELRSESDIEGLARAGRLAAAVLAEARAACVAGASTGSIEGRIRAAILAGGGEPLFLGYRGTAAARPAFPASACISVNEELVHGVPGSRVVRDGDLVSIDVGVRLDGWCADSAITVGVGDVDADRRALVACAEEMLDRAISLARPGVRWSSVAREIERIADLAGFAIAVDFVGHGIGRELHEPPQVPCSVDRNFLERGDFTLRPGMVLAIEPMVVLARPQRAASGERAGELIAPACTLADDGWTVVVDSGAASCHVEHTVVVTRDGARILTAERHELDSRARDEGGLRRAG
jgi:methionyl aminopeptidase